MPKPPDNPQPPEPWFVRAFGAEYPQLYARRDDEEARAQVAALLSSGLLVRGRVLDLACGAGRHLKALRAAGFTAWGLDLSPALLRAGGVRGVVRADMRRVPFADAVFDAVLSLFTSFGYFDDAGNLGVLAGCRRVLARGGRLILDVPNPGPTIASLVGESCEKTPHGEIVARRRVEGRRVVKEVEWTAPGAAPARWHESVRLYEPAELDAALTLAGLATAGRYADFAGGAFEPSRSARQLVVAS